MGLRLTDHSKGYTSPNHLIFFNLMKSETHIMPIQYEDECRVFLLLRSFYSVHSIKENGTPFIPFLFRDFRYWAQEHSPACTCIHLYLQWKYLKMDFEKYIQCIHCHIMHTSLPIRHRPNQSYLKKMP